jgi:hypothetical protein
MRRASGFLPIRSPNSDSVTDELNCHCLAVCRYDANSLDPKSIAMDNWLGGTRVIRTGKGMVRVLSKIHHYLCYGFHSSE